MAFDPDSYLSDQQVGNVAGTSATAGTFNPDQYLSGTAVLETVAPEVSMPAPAYVMTSPTGINPAAVKQSLQPILDIVPRTYQQYTAPGGAIKGALDILGVSSVGVPPVAAMETAKSIARVPGAVKETIAGIGRGTSAIQDLNPQAFNTFYDALRPADRTLLQAAVTEKGASALRDFAVPDYIRNNPAASEAFNVLKGQVPSGMQQLGRVVGPALRGVAKVAGPAGLAYDIYQAQPYMAEAGQQLQSGQANQAMRGARQAMLNAPTPAPLSDQELLNLLNSGDQRLINIYGGEAALQARIRRKAAEKVLAQ